MRAPGHAVATQLRSQIGSSRPDAQHVELRYVSAPTLFPLQHREGIMSSVQMLRDLDPLFYGKEQ